MDSATSPGISPYIVSVRITWCKKRPIPNGKPEQKRRHCNIYPTVIDCDRYNKSHLRFPLLFIWNTRNRLLKYPMPNPTNPKWQNRSWITERRFLLHIPHMAMLYRNPSSFSPINCKTNQCRRCRLPNTLWSSRWLLRMWLLQTRSPLNSRQWSRIVSYSFSSHTNTPTCSCAPTSPLSRSFYLLRICRCE